MNLTMFNTLSNKLEPFQEIEKNRVGLYTCGPTVYDHAHIGNFRSYIFEDLLKRYLIYRGFQVRHVMNITDIDDKTIKRSRDEGIPIGQLTGRFIAGFFADLGTLNILRADVYPRAMEHIPEMIALIEKLIGKGYGYQKEDSVYFSIKKFPTYGRLANVDPENLKTGVSQDVDEYEKDHVTDFVLWKGRKEDEPYWDSPFGPGRPGWHIECSAMSMKYLGEQFDIHMGGVDNIFPHHENEIAQAEAATGKKFVNYWLHCQHLVVDNKKMSKSLGNFYTLKDLTAKGYDPMAIRYLLISSHYRKSLNFTLAGLDMAAQSLKRINDFIFTLKGLKAKKGETPEMTSLIERTEAEFQKQMDDDLNISGALGAFFDYIHQANLQLDQMKTGDIQHLLDFTARISQVIGIHKEEQVADLAPELMEKINQRQQARKDKNFALADSLRRELQILGITLIDTPTGVRWKKE